MLFWEIINVTFNNFRLAIAFSDSLDATGFSAFLFKSTAITSLISFLFVIIGTNGILRFLGERVALLLIPLLTGAVMCVSLWYQTSTMIIVAWTCIRVINLSLTSPLKESLYIPTSREIQFKTKSWIDSFGQKFAKGCGSLYVKALQFFSPYIAYLIQLHFLCIVVFVWSFLAYYLGKKWTQAIDKKKIIE
jgi:ATP/ADP translocase